MPKISILVPVYQVEAYLQRCVESIRAQSFSDFDVILVDDGSPDRCPAMCDAYAVQDPRIHVIHLPHQGVSAARNAGLDWIFSYSDSQYLMFVDSDDWIHPRMLEWMLETLQKTHAEVCAAKMTLVSSPRRLWFHGSCSYREMSIDVFYRTQSDISTVLWGKLYARELFKEIRCPVGKIHEDEFITHQILFQFDSVPVITTPLYFYFRNPNSITRSAWTPQRLDTFEARKKRLQFFKEHGKKELVHCKAEFYIDQLMHLPAKQYFQPLFEEFRDRLVPELHLDECDAVQTPQLYKFIQRLKEHPECADFIFDSYQCEREYMLAMLKKISGKHRKYRKLFNITLVAWIVTLLVFAAWSLIGRFA